MAKFEVEKSALAKKRWPKSKVWGQGQFAVLTCAYFHPSARRMQYAEIHLFATRDEAAEYQKTMYCHADTKGLCSGKHDIVDLGG
ncbi:MAG: hypothetical protein ABSC47_03270 [Terracidiphilus sp.]|jgi:hypothetical protein